MSMETFGEIFLTIFGLFWVLVTVVFILCAYDNYYQWKKNKMCGFAKSSQTSDDFSIERKNILFVVRQRRYAVETETEELKEEMAALEDSSEFASLVRCAHYAGCHISFEQNEQGWSSDPEYLDPNVFKTDMGEAAALREEREWDGYKRYFDPPMSKRDRMLNRNP